MVRAPLHEEEDLQAMLLDSEWNMDEDPGDMHFLEDGELDNDEFEHWEVEGNTNVVRIYNSSSSQRLAFNKEVTIAGCH